MFRIHTVLISFPHEKMTLLGGFRTFPFHRQHGTVRIYHAFMQFLCGYEVKFPLTQKRTATFSAKRESNALRIYRFNVGYCVMYKRYNPQTAFYGHAPKLVALLH